MDFSFDQISKIVEQSKEETFNNQKYRLLVESFLRDFWDRRINKTTLFCIYITKDNLEKIDFSSLKNNIQSWNEIIATNNFLEIDSNGQVIEKQYKYNDSTEKVKNILIELSKDNYVFFFGEEGITRYANGIVLEDKNIFYTREDRLKYKQKKDISKIHEVINEYSTSYLSNQVNYMCFLADNATLRQLPQGNQLIKCNILKNKPEHYMRDQLKQYLTDNMQYTFTCEPELLQTKRELDIYFDVKGDLYFIEVKWLGRSINDTGTDLGTAYGNSRVNEGVIQSLEYIQELSNTAETSLRFGYLAIFDCRDNKSEIKKTNYSFVSEELQPYLSSFGFLPIINVNKRHPA